MFAIQALRDHCAPIVTAIWRWLSNVVHVPFAACILALAIAFSVPVAESRANDPVVAVVHVTIDREWPSQDPEDGESWGTAFRFLQDALTRAHQLLDDPQQPPDLEVEIWVAEGTYRPGQSNIHCGVPCEPWSPYVGDCSPPCGNINTHLSFELLNNVGIFDGFDGTETLRSDRKPLENMTILSGDYGNVQRIVYGQNNNNTARLDGFHITKAWTAIELSDSSAVISNCTLRDTDTSSDVGNVIPVFEAVRPVSQIA